MSDTKKPDPLEELLSAMADMEQEREEQAAEGTKVLERAQIAALKAQKGSRKFKTAPRPLPVIEEEDVEGRRAGRL